jgi:hypothetical protein
MSPGAKFTILAFTCLNNLNGPDCYVLKMEFITCVFMHVFVHGFSCVVKRIPCCLFLFC